VTESSKSRFRALTILFGSAMTVLAAAILSPALPAIGEAFQDVPNADFLVPLVLTMTPLFTAIGSPFAGTLLDRVGRKPVLVTGVILYAVAGTSGYVLESLFAILVGRALLGLSVAGIMSGFTTLIGDYYSGPRLRQMVGYQGAFMALGGVVFVLAGGLLADLGWRFPFLTYLYAILILIGVLFTIDEPDATQRNADAAVGTKWAEVPVKSIAVIYAFAFVSMALFYIVVVQLPFYLRASAGVTLGQIGLALAAQALVAFVMSLFYGRIKARLSYQTIGGLIFLTMGIGYLVIFLGGSYVASVAGLFVSGIGLGLLLPNMNLWLVSLAPASLRGRAVGGLTMLVFFGQFMSPILFRPVENTVGLLGGFAVAAGIFLLLAAIFFAAGRREATRNAPLEAEVSEAAT
jgi:MFS family permease